MFFVLLISILIFSIIDTIVARIWGSPVVYIRLAYHFLFVPFISGISYEVLKLSGKNMKHPLVKLMTAPGLAHSLISFNKKKHHNDPIEYSCGAEKFMSLFLIGLAILLFKFFDSAFFS